MHVILDAMQMMGIGFQTSGLESAVDLIKRLPHQIETEYLDPAVAYAIGQLWRDAGVRQCFERSREYQLRDHTLTSPSHP